MRLSNSDVNMVSLFPTWMRRNEDDAALASVVDRAAAEIYEGSRLLSIWNKIDELPEGVLDELAYELDIDWYDSGAPLDVKRRLVKQSDFVHSKLGTVAAVESVISAYFGDGRLMEWSEYGGEPHHFKVFTTNASALNENLTRFLSMLRKIKRHSSKLDSVMIGLTGEEYVNLGDGFRDFCHEVHIMGEEKMLVFLGAAESEREHVRVYMGVEPGPEGDLVIALVYDAKPVEHDSVQVRMLIDDPLEGDIVTGRLVGVAQIIRDTLTIRAGVPAFTN